MYGNLLSLMGDTCMGQTSSHRQQKASLTMLPLCCLWGLRRGVLRWVMCLGHHQAPSFVGAEVLSG